jgi:hypothetical protein
VSWPPETPFPIMVVSSDRVGMSSELPTRCRSDPNRMSLAIELVPSDMECK